MNDNIELRLEGDAGTVVGEGVGIVAGDGVGSVFGEVVGDGVASWRCSRGSS